MAMLAGHAMLLKNEKTRRKSLLQGERNIEKSLLQRMPSDTFHYISDCRIEPKKKFFLHTLAKRGICHNGGLSIGGWYLRSKDALVS